MQRASGSNNRVTESQKVNAAASARMRAQFPRFFNQGTKHVLVSAKELSGGMTNHTYLARTKSNAYIARIPGNGSDHMIKREHESYNTKIAVAAGITPEVVYDEENGKKVTRYLQNPMELSSAALRRPDNMLQVIDILKKLHGASPFANTINIFARNREWIKRLFEMKYDLPWDYALISAEIDKIEKEILAYDVPSVPCHMDTTPGNFVFSNGKLYLIDFEYAGNGDPVWDLAYLSVETEMTASQNDFMLRAYFGDALTDDIKRRFTLYLPVVEYHIGLWCLMQIANNSEIVDKDELEKTAKQFISRCRQTLATVSFKTSQTMTPINIDEPEKQPEKSKPAATLFKRVRTVVSLAKDAVSPRKNTI